MQGPAHKKKLIRLVQPRSASHGEKILVTCQIDVTCHFSRRNDGTIDSDRGPMVTVSANLKQKFCSYLALSGPQFCNGPTPHKNVTPPHWHAACCMRRRSASYCSNPSAAQSAAASSSLCRSIKASAADAVRFSGPPTQTRACSARNLKRGAGVASAIARMASPYSRLSQQPPPATIL